MPPSSRSIRKRPARTLALSFAAIPLFGISATAASAAPAPSILEPAGAGQWYYLANYVPSIDHIDRWTTTSLGGFTHTYAIGAHIQSDATWTLNGACTKLQGYAGVEDDGTTSGQYQLDIVADSTNKYSRSFGRGEGEAFSVDISGARNLTLGTVPSFSYDAAHGFAETRIYCTQPPGSFDPVDGTSLNSPPPPTQPFYWYYLANYTPAKSYISRKATAALGGTTKTYAIVSNTESSGTWVINGSCVKIEGYAGVEDDGTSSGTYQIDVLSDSQRVYQNKFTRGTGEAFQADLSGAQTLTIGTVPSFSYDALHGVAGVRVACTQPPGTFASVDKLPESPTLAPEFPPLKLNIPARASAVRGDLDGDGKRDELMVTKTGALQRLGGKADGTFAAAVTIPGAWSWVNWIGSPGDLNGDGYQDALFRDKNGDLKAYYGDGKGGFGSNKTIGNGWGQMDPSKLFAITKFTNGATSLMAVNTTNCYLYRYDFSAAGTINAATVIGTGWCGMAQVFSNGDNNGDGISDVVGITKTGDYLVYPGGGNGKFAATQTKQGHGWSFTQVTAPGDADGNGYDDVLARTCDGKVYQYLTGPHNTWLANPTVQTNWAATYAVME